MSTFDASILTLGEIATIEKLSGQPIGAMGDPAAPKGAAMAALAMVAKRRGGFPGYTWKEAQGLTLTEAQELLGLDTADDDETLDTAEDIDLIAA